MERKRVIIGCVVGLLGLLSAVTGFAAEATRIKGSEVQFLSTTQCMYPRSPAMSLGLTAATALIVAQVLLNASTGCVCCRRNNARPLTTNWKIALLCFIVSWFTFVLGFVLLLTGAALNDQHGLETMYFGNYYCYVVKPGVFAFGAVLSFLSVALGLFYYRVATSIPKDGNAPRLPSQLAMGQPQFPVPPPQHSSQDPVFVHEDTYIRRNFT